MAVTGFDTIRSGMGYGNHKHPESGGREDTRQQEATGFD
jgi:hypothetical protein